MLNLALSVLTSSTSASEKNIFINYNTSNKYVYIIISSIMFPNRSSKLFIIAIEKYLSNILNQNEI